MPQAKDTYAVIKKDANGKVTVTTLTGKDVTKLVKQVSLDRAIAEKEEYMYINPTTGLWTRERGLNSNQWKDIEAYTKTGASTTVKAVAPKKAVVKPGVKTTTKVSTPAMSDTSDAQTVEYSTVPSS